MCVVPALALSAAVFAVPLIMKACLYDTGVFNFPKCKEEQFSKAFPSDWLLRKHNWHQATRDAILLGNQLKTKRIYMASDKGNKKGIGHMAKVLCSWNTDDPNTIPFVDTRMLDIDAAGGTHKECAEGINASMNKLKAHDNDSTHLLAGQATDSGGGGTLEGLADALHAIGNVCAPREECLIASCSLHALQLQLGNAIKTTFGEGAPDKVNCMQLIHSAFRLQEPLNSDEWRHVLQKSSDFVVSFDPTSIVTDQATIDSMSVADQNRNKFLIKHNKVLAFHPAFKKASADPDRLYKQTVLQKMQQPILTRWWTVGVGSSFVFDCCLALFHACQTVVNAHNSDRTPCMIASHLCSMMSDQENFIDVTLIRCFHKACMFPHFDWFQSCTDLSNTVGFQAHNAVGRCYLMNRNMSVIVSGMPECTVAVNNWVGDGVNDAADQERHLTKVKVFMREAHSSLHKHFPRWLNDSLLPAALLSEAPLRVSRSSPYQVLLRTKSCWVKR